MWAGVVGFMVTVFVGYTISYILEKTNYQGPITLYINDDHASINTDLFSPPKARALRKRLGKLVANGGNVELNEGKMLKDSNF
jgi:solute carrier family 5 (sodium-coupled monocarboxylate transporter), member 8/12